MRPTLDLLAAALGETVEKGGQSSDMVAQFGPLALNKPTVADAQALQGAALNQLVKHMIQHDPDFPANATSAELKNYKRQKRRAAFQILLSAHHEEQAAAMTHEEFNIRVETAKASKFAEHILARAKQLAASKEVDVTVTASDGGALPDFDEDFAEHEEQLEGDAENLLDSTQRDTDGQVRLELSLDEEMEETDNAVNLVSYEDQVRAMMYSILENTSAVTLQWKDNPDQECPLCIADPTMSQAAKVRHLHPSLT